MKKSIPCFTLILKSTNICVQNGFVKVLDLCIFLSWFRRDYLFTGGSVSLDFGVIFYPEANIWFVFINMEYLSLPDIKSCTEVVRALFVLLWCFYQLYGLSFWRHPFTAEHPLLSKWCNTTFLQTCSDEETNSSWMAWGWVHVQQNVIFGWTNKSLL